MIKPQETLEKYGYLPGSKRTSTKPVIVECDYCKNVFEKEYKRYLKGRKDLQKDCCAGCIQLKINELNSIRGHHATRQDVKDKKKTTNLAKYGVDNPFKSSQIQDKIKSTNLARYGVEYPMQAKGILEKSYQTTKSRYGVNRPLQNKEILLKSQQTNFEKYGNKNYCKSEDFFEETYSEELANLLNDANALKDLHHTQKIAINKIANMYGIPVMNMHRIFRKHGIEPKRFYNSSSENEILEYVRSLGFNASNKRINNNKIELDIFVPEKNIAIEANGLYWHSEIHVDKNYHLNKTLECEKQGIRLVHVFEDEWICQKDIVKSRIRSILGISNRFYARKCNIVELNKEQRSKFFNSTHLQGDVHSSVCYGLIYGKEIVAAMSFGKPRFNRKYEYELLRYSSSGNVIGGASKIFSHFVKNNNPRSIISYCDRRYGTGNLYLQMGFIKIQETEPNYFWVKGDRRHSRYRFMKSRLIKEGFDPSKTEDQIMHERGFIKIYDCGNYVFEWNA